jgi:cell division septation protein DedD
MSRMAQAREDDPMDGPPRSIFATLWFRALLVVLVLGAVAAVAVPYVLDVVNPPAGGPMLATPPRPVESAPAATSPPAPPPQPAAPTPPGGPPAPGAAAVAPAPASPSAAAPDADRTATPTSAADRPGTPTGERPADSAATGAVAGSSVAAPPGVGLSPEPRKPAPKIEVQPGGTWWVQVGAFRDAAAARRLAARLREQNYPVQESVKRVATATVAAAPTGDTSSDRYDVFVSGLAPAEIQSRLAARGLAADPVAGGAVVKPGLPLRDAVALSRELAAEGLKVQVRRQGSAEAGSTAAAGAAGTLHRVRVGAFADRAAALAVARELETRGYRPFLTRDGS